MNDSEPTLLVWIDVETNGTHSDCAILEVAAVVTDIGLSETDSFHRVVNHGDDVLGTMNPWCEKHHVSSGLVADCRRSRHSYDDVDDALSAFLQRHKALSTPQAVLVPSGFNVHFDMGRLERHMPRSWKSLTYRHFDLSTLNYIQEWIAKPDFPIGQAEHRALPDCLFSIDVARSYQQKSKEDSTRLAEMIERLDQLDQLTQAVNAHNATIQQFIGHVFEDEKPPPEKRKRVIRADAEGAKNARVGRGAARRGWTYKQWLETFGRKEYPELSVRNKKKADRGPR